MPDDVDACRWAMLLIERHGDDAAVVAARRADELLEQGDLAGSWTWHQILAAIGRRLVCCTSLLVFLSRHTHFP